MTGDPDGQWRGALESMGAVVGRFDPEIRVYTANVTPDVVERLATADFVLAIEPVGVVKAAHDTAVPAMGADDLRTYSGSPGLFTGIGGASTPIGVMDSGLNINHLDIASHRESICGANFVYFNPLFDDQDLWVDQHGHGTHVTGTIAGNGYVEPRYGGMAPSVGHIRIAKVLNHLGGGNESFILRGMDFLSRTSACPEAGWTDTQVKPLIVNASLSRNGLTFAGRGAAARKLDSIVWSQGQLYVVAQSNAGIYGFSNYGAAKNSLSVGAAYDDGSLATFSSRGPTADGRLLPQVVGTGVGVYSAAGDASRSGYRILSGTSMSSPAVAGVAALMMDAVAGYRGRPSLSRARLMASAIRPDVWLEEGSGFAAHNTDGPGPIQAEYGLGKVSARTSILNRNRTDGWMSRSLSSRLSEGEYAYRDIVVPEGATRLDLVLTWDDPPTETIANAVLNDLDLWLDRDADCETAACGEHASRSRTDNVEWLFIRNSSPGVYRAKVVAERVYAAKPRSALAWTVIRGASTPDVEISVDREVIETGSGKPQVELTVKARSYVAAGTVVYFDCRREDGRSCESSRSLTVAGNREDDVEFQSNVNVGSTIVIGELAVGETWQADLTLWEPTPANGDAYRLYISTGSWNANPASTSVLVRSSKTTGTEPLQAAAPANDWFADARMLEGAEGTMEVDLLGATAEPGEPLAQSSEAGRPTGSVWYRWTAPATAAVSFGAVRTRTTNAGGGPFVDIFEGNRVTALKSIGSRYKNVRFFAEQGKTYLIRVRHEERSLSPALRLEWAQDSRPSNDDFSAAAVIEGTEGSVAGNNSGATLEPGEWFGDLAGTTWYRWTAPVDGRWVFALHPQQSSMVVLAFTGNDVANLRLASGFPNYQAEFAARADDTYFLAVASKSAFRSGMPYELSWRETERDAGNDDFQGAVELAGTESSSQYVDMDSQATVEPGEPSESGIRTRWWSWTAPADGAYTWLLDELTRPTFRPNNRLLVSVFEGESLSDLQLVATNGPNMSVKTSFAAVAGQRYWISVGLPARDSFAFAPAYINGFATLVWGLAPDNDDSSTAVAATGANGSISGSILFATTALGERTDLLGHSSLWWTYEPENTGWIRFAVRGAGDWALVVFRDAGDGTGSLETVTTNRWQRIQGATREVIFEAQAGVRYTIAIGARGAILGGEFNLDWSATEAPVWLRYAGRLGDGDADAAGKPVVVRDPAGLAFHTDGKTMFLASSAGLQVFGRKAETGELTLLQSLEGDLMGNSLIWDPHRSRLLAYRCGNWRSFAQDADSLRLDEGTPLSVANDSGRCSPYLFMDAGGEFLYRAGAGHVELLTVDASGSLRFVDSYQDEGWIRDALIGADGTHVYAVGESVGSDLLHVYARNTDTGTLSWTDYRHQLIYRAETLALSHDGSYLFVFDDDGERVNVLGLENPAVPDLLGTLPRFWEARPGYGNSRCQFARPHPEIHAVDVVCPSSAYSVNWQPETGTLEGTDHVSSWQADRFNELVLEFGAPAAAAASPDGGHIYLSTPRHGIVIFERIGNRSGETASVPDD